MKEKPKISIVTCSFNQARFLESTICSVLQQEYEALEYIVIDGASRDGSKEIIERYQSELAYWVSEPDDGQTDALIKGFARATGDIQGWLCSDDLLLPGALDAVSTFFEKNPDVNVVYGDALWIDAAGRPIRAKREIPWNLFVFLFDHNYLAQPSVFWRRSLYEQAGGLDRQWNLAMDADLWLRFARQSHPVHLPAYLSCMRFYPEQKTRAMKPDGRIEDERLRMREYPRLSRLPRLPLRALARAQRWYAKARVGGYHASVPQELEPWLDGLRTQRTPAVA